VEAGRRDGFGFGCLLPTAYCLLIGSMRGRALVADS
jgi:hypothetical protein